MKNRFAIIIFIFINVLLIGSLFLYSINTVKASNSQVIGDVNSDGKVGSTDYILIRKYILKTITLTDNQKKLADVNSDKKITSLDYIKIKQIVINGGNIKVNPTSKPTIAPTINPNETYIEAYFLNTINNQNYNKAYTYETNDAFIFKIGSKYILLDTGIKTVKGNTSIKGEIKKIIYDELKRLQKKDTVTIDYLVLSHMHADHYGNLTDILDDEKMIVKKLIFKNEPITNKKGSNEIIESAKKNRINYVDTNTISEELVGYTLSNNVKMYLFNIKDVYNSRDDCTTSHHYIAYKAKHSPSFNYAKDTNGKYIYIEGKEYIDHMTNGTALKVYTTSTAPNHDVKVSDTPTNKMNKRFYAIVEEGKRTDCSPNANSIVVVFKITTQQGNKYIYLPSDLENTGYSELGEYDSKYNIMIDGYNKAHYDSYVEKNGSIQFVIENNNFVSKQKVRKASEYLTAKQVVHKFNDITKNLVIYQQSHHGINNSWAALDVLKVNRSGVYTVAASASDPTKTVEMNYIESEYLLQKTNILFVGKKKNGIKCTIKGSGTTYCGEY